MRQSIDAMARLSGSYWDFNPHMPIALAAQKADYLFGGGLILVAFTLQLVSFFVPATQVLTETQALAAPWFAAVGTFVVFFLLRFASQRLALHYELKIIEWLKQKRGNVPTEHA